MTMRGEKSRCRIVSSACMTDSDSSPKSISTLASTATSGLAGAAGIIELHKLIVELVALFVGQPVTAGTIFCADQGADRSLFGTRFLSLHGLTLTGNARFSEPNA